MADVPNTWPLNGYAPGNYMCRCVSCKQQFQGDKRAYQCLDCAVRQVQSLLSALLSERERRTAQGVTVPDGWKLVPIEPTEAMMNAGLYQSGHDAEWADVYSAWRDMVSFAPSLSSSAGGGERG